MRENFYNMILYGIIAMWFFNGLDFAFNVTTDKKDDKTVISVEKKPEKKTEDKDTIKTDW